MTIALQVDQVRAGGIGASDAAAALGLDRYRAPIQVWLELRGGAREDKPASVNEAAEWGQALEPIIRGKYALNTGAAVFVPIASSVLDGWLRATPDGIAVHGKQAGGCVEVNSFESIGITQAEIDTGDIGLLQVKTCSAYKHDEWLHGPPAAYEVQCRVEMAVTKLPWCDIVCLVGGQKLVGPFRILRDLKLEENILKDLAYFYALVLQGIEPAVDGSDAWKSYAGSRMGEGKLEINADQDMEMLIRERGVARKRLAECIGRVNELTTGIMLHLSAAGASKVRTSSGACATAYQAGGGTDWKGYALELGANAKNIPPKFKRPAKTWALRVTGEEDD